MQCVHIKKKDGKQCEKHAMRGRRQCRVHGGRGEAIGPINAQWRHGRHSPCLPPKLLALYHQGLEDPELLALKHEIALCDSRVAELTQLLENHQGGTTLTRLHAVTKRLVLCVQKDDMAKASDYGTNLLQIIDSGWEEKAIWKEIQELVEIRRRLTETELKRQMALSQLIPVTKAMSLLTTVVDGFKRIIVGKCGPELTRELLTSLGDELSRVLNPTHAAAIRARSEPRPVVVNSGSGEGVAT